MESKDNNWHLSRTISIGHLATTVVVVVGSVIYLGDIKENVRVNNVEIENIKDSRERNRARYDNMFERIDKKLDRLFEYITEANGKN